jgi:hypothetical protein
MLNIDHTIYLKSNYNELLKNYDKNHNKKWTDWLKFDTVFKQPGKQGVVGLLELKDNDKVKYVFKISQYINFLVKHECTIINGLKELYPYCPHFCKGIGFIRCKTEPKYNKKDGNPFEIHSKYPIERDILLYEYIDDSYKFYNYIKNEHINEDILYSTIKQVLLAISIAQKKKEFTHYDLHSCNIMMKRCNRDIVFLYILDEENQFYVPTYGHYPVIIDFGFSYIKDMEDGPLWTSLAHTDVGFMSDRFDWVADPKLFLVTVSGEIDERRDTKKSNKLRTVVKNIFKPLKIDWNSGWDVIKDKGAADYIVDIMDNLNEKSQIFDEYGHYCIDIIQSLIVLPLQYQSHTDIESSFNAFLKEWIKIENEIGSPFYNLYVLKEVVDSARYLHSDYISKDVIDKTNIILKFKNDILNAIQKIAKYCNPKNVNYEVLLCSLLIMARCSEGILYTIIKNRMKQKTEDYKKLPLQSVEQIYAAIEVNVQTNYKFNEDTTVIVMDCMNKKLSSFKLDDEQINEINDIHSLSKGTFLYEIYKN